MSGERTRVASGTAWETAVGYSRAVRVGRVVYVSGTTATDDAGAVVGPGDAYAQTRQAIANLAAALHQANATLKDVVRTRLFVTDIDRWRDVGRAHAEAFAEIAPACTMVQVARLIDPAMLVEIEAEAIAPDDGWLEDALR